MEVRISFPGLLKLFSFSLNYVAGKHTEIIRQVDFTNGDQLHGFELPGFSHVFEK